MMMSQHYRTWAQAARQLVVQLPAEPSLSHRACMHLKSYYARTLSTRTHACMLPHSLSLCVSHSIDQRVRVCRRRPYCRAAADGPMTTPPTRGSWHECPPPAQANAHTGCVMQAHTSHPSHRATSRHVSITYMHAWKRGAAVVPASGSVGSCIACELSPRQHSACCLLQGGAPACKPRRRRWGQSPCPCHATMTV